MYATTSYSILEHLINSFFEMKIHSVSDWQNIHCNQRVIINKATNKFFANKKNSQKLVKKGDVSFQYFMDIAN